VIAAALGRGYQGRHRLEAAALGLPLTAAGPAAPGTARAEIPVSATTLAPSPVLGPVLGPVLAPAPTALTHACGARLTVVPVAASADPLIDTMPHPVVKLFPLPLAEPVSEPVAAVEGEQAVFADVDEAREEQVTAELAAGAAPASSYQGRHSA
jgi:hypothetical protein